MATGAEAVPPLKVPSFPDRRMRGRMEAHAVGLEAAHMRMNALDLSRFEMTA